MCCGGDEDNERNNNYKNADYSDPNYEGEPTDERLADGPLEERHCTDVLCCLIFIAFWVVLAVVA